jgi:hypothetical protein
MVCIPFCKFREIESSFEFASHVLCENYSSFDSRMPTYAWLDETTAMA